LEGFGGVVTSEDHAEAVEAIVGSLRGRILGVGAEQYDDGSGVQRFEMKPLEAIVTDAVEEIDDLIVYLCQIRLRLTGGVLSNL
jgi:hypothetical protein